jgi:hypothetical protein
MINFLIQIDEHDQVFLINWSRQDKGFPCDRQRPRFSARPKISAKAEEPPPKSGTLFEL